METVVLTNKNKFKIDNANEISAKPNEALIVGMGPHGATIYLTGSDDRTSVFTFDWQHLLDRIFFPSNLETVWNRSSELDRIRFLESIRSAIAQGVTTSGPCYLVYPRVP